MTLEEGALGLGRSGRENVLLALAAGRDDNTVARSGFVASIIGKDVGLIDTGPPDSDDRQSESDHAAARSRLP